MGIPDIFDADDLVGWLQGAVNWWVDQERNRSLRRFAALAGIPMGTFSHVLKGTRHLQGTHEEGVANVLGLDLDERSVLTELCAVQRGGPHDAERKLRLRGRQAMLRSKQIGRRDAPLVASWTTMVVREMSAMPGFRDDAMWIAARIRPRVPLEEIEESLAVLRLMRPSVADPANLMSTGVEPQWQPAESVQQRILDVACEAGARPRDSRYFQTYVATVPVSAVPKLKAAMVEFLEKVIAVCDTEPGEKERLVQISAQLVPLFDPADGPGLLGAGLADD
jgi:uncharacterized protein (TIGR02147 family)